MAAVAGAAVEPLRLALVGDHFLHQSGAAGRPEEMAAAAALLRRALPAAALRRIALQPFRCSPASLAGPQAGWVSELAPLAGAVESVELAGFGLEAGDLTALSAALPRMRALSLFMCQLDVDAVRHLQDEQRERPSLALMVDASCRYVTPYGTAPDGAEPYGEEGPVSDEFVDEAEIPELDPEPHGIWPVAVELQRAYERALDVTDDERGGDTGDDAEEGEGEELGEGEEAEAGLELY
ncbi:hypothetical protein GPECTOR_4g664 [Gonium pectorale]|uniref:Uncharacterized protein n=1 Tax=Gonium pectorale TaxID=33097 RepID=A0A150GXP8_GONPE|nr:hypothetical protein GPECTOR_4g664 [Gonium pectorale]|eukprot:KXZ54599.1 hypothetical protein GPECTOR_4g664 [Gonium pectorale]